MTNKRRLALFDLDHTLLPLDSDYQWAQYLALNGHAGDPEQALRRNDELMDRYNAGTLSAEESYGFMLGLLTLGTVEQLEHWRSDYIKQIIQPAVTPQALELVNNHANNGDLCAIVTATNNFVTKPIAPLFNIKHLVATEAELKEGKYTGNMVGKPCYQEGKILHLNNWLAGMGFKPSDFEEIWFYSDSINDLPLLEAVSHPVATNPSPSLRKIAQERSWKTLDLFSELADHKS